MKGYLSKLFEFNFIQVGQTVYFIKDNKPTTGEVKEVEIKINCTYNHKNDYDAPKEQKEIYVKYGIKAESQYLVWLNEKHVFKTKKNFVNNFFKEQQ